MTEGVSKKELREQIKQLKKHFPADKKHSQSESIFEKLQKTKAFINSKIVLMYWSLPDEVCTHNFIEQIYKQKTILLPVVSGDTLDLKMFTGKDKMILGSFGIAEPNGQVFTSYNEIDLIVVPGVAFDKHNNRMGRGRGYYDRLLSLSKALKVGVCFDFQFANQVPVEKHDIPMDIVIHG